MVGEPRVEGADLPEVNFYPAADFGSFDALGNKLNKRKNARMIGVLSVDRFFGCFPVAIYRWPFRDFPWGDVGATGWTLRVPS